MKRVWKGLATALLVCIGILGALTVQAQASAGEPLRLAVISFTNKAPVTWQHFGDYAPTAEEYLVYEMNRSGRFDVIEREQLKAILDEHSLQMTGLVSPDTIGQVGKLAGVDYVAIGSITGLTCKTTKSAVYDDNRDNAASLNRYKVRATVMLRVVDVNTGRIRLYGRGTADSVSTRTTAAASGFVVRFGSAAVSEEQCDSAVKKAAHDAIYGKEGILTQLDGKG